MKANAQETARKAIKCVNGIVNIIVLTIILLLLAFAGYALWDSKQIHLAADKSQYEVYKPTVENEGISFRELQAVNPEVFAWLTIYETHVDYPVAQGENNSKYVTTSAEGTYSLSGSIFLDCNNSRDFSDFNSILYGHHMERSAMFGDIGTFSHKDVFEADKYGNLYFDGRDHGIEFFAFIHADAYDREVFAPNVGEEDRAEYLNKLLAKAMYKRDAGVTTEDHIVLLSTCSASSTNGRDVLVGKIVDEVFEDPALSAGEAEQAPADVEYCYVIKIPLWAQMLLLLALLIAVRLAVSIIAANRKRKYCKRGQKRGEMP